MPQPPEVVHNEARHRFELIAEGQLARLDYERSGKRIALTLTIVPEEIEGEGNGAALARAALDYARREKLQVIPACHFVRVFIQRHPEYADLVEK
jgi:predicted GNAT family acetyltransferase